MFGFPQQCLNFINSSYYDLVSILENNYPPTVACETLGFCTGTVESGKQQPDRLPSVIGESAPFSRCEGCELIVSVTEDYVNRTGLSVPGVLYVWADICEELSSPYNSTCTSFMDSIGLAVSIMLVEQVPPIDICRNLTFCPPEPNSGSSSSNKSDDEMNEIVASLTFGNGSSSAERHSFACALCTFFDAVSFLLVEGRSQ